jgi:NAD+ kinase
MPVPQQTIALVVRHNTAGIDTPLAGIVEYLQGAGYRVVFEAETAAHLGTTGIEAISVAQIGAQAVAIRWRRRHHAGRRAPAGAFEVPLIASTWAGWLDRHPDRAHDPVLDDICAAAEAERAPCSKGRVMRAGAQIASGLAVNDVVVARGGGAGMVELKVTVDGHFMYNQRSDGLIIATPTGSTAYALSAGGPLLHPSLSGIGLVPIAPHALSNRPIVVPDTSEIVVEVVSGRDVSVNFDMQTFASLVHGDQIIISRSPNSITFLHPEGWNYYDTLREKLHWNEYPSGEGKLT